MRTSYDPETDAMFIRFGPHCVKSAETDEVAPGIILDFDDRRQVVRHRDPLRQPARGETQGSGLIRRRRPASGRGDPLDSRRCGEGSSGAGNFAKILGYGLCSGAEFGRAWKPGVEIPGDSPEIALIGRLVALPKLIADGVPALPPRIV